MKRPRSRHPCRSPQGARVVTPRPTASGRSPDSRRGRNSRRGRQGPGRSATRPRRRALRGQVPLSPEPRRGHRGFRRSGTRDSGSRPQSPPSASAASRVVSQPRRESGGAVRVANLLGFCSWVVSMLLISRDRENFHRLLVSRGPLRAPAPARSRISRPQSQWLGPPEHGGTVARISMASGKFRAGTCQTPRDSGGVRDRTGCRTLRVHDGKDQTDEMSRRGGGGSRRLLAGVRGRRMRRAVKGRHVHVHGHRNEQPLGDEPADVYADSGRDDDLDRDEALSAFPLPT